MFYLALSASFDYLYYGSMTLRIFLVHLVGDRFYTSESDVYTSESDVYRRQILTYKDGLRAERVNMKGLDSLMPV